MPNVRVLDVSVRGDVTVLGSHLRSRISTTLPALLARDAALVFGATMLGNVGAYILHSVAARRLGVVDYGNLYALITTLTFLSVVTTAATLIIVRTSSHLSGSENHAALAGFVRWVHGKTVLAAVLVTALALALSPVVGSFLHVDDVSAIIAWAFLMGATFLVPGFHGVLQGIEDFHAFAVANAIAGFGRGALGVLALAIGLGTTGVLAAQCVAVILSCAVALRWLHRYHTTEQHEFLPDTRFAWGSVWVVLATLFSTALASVDVILAKHFLTPRDGGLYSVLALCGKTLLFVGGFVPALLVPKAAAAVAGGRSATPLLRKALLVSVACSGGGLVLYLIAPRLIVVALAGSAYGEGAKYLPIYGAAMVLLATTNIMVSYQIAVHRFRFVVPLAVTVVLEIVAAWRWHADIPQLLLVLLFANAASVAASAVGIRGGPGNSPAIVR